MTPLVNRGPLSKERPFPGPYAYREEDAQEGYFRGRTRETKELCRLIQRNSLTVLFGASGLGKSSLIAAGLFPELRRLGRLPLRVKLNYDAKSAAPLDLSRQIMADVRQAARAAQLEVENGHDRPTLWEFFHGLELWSPEPSLIPPVVVLDQFEEAFTLGGQTSETREAVIALFRDLGDLVENRMPATVATGRGPGNLTTVSVERPPLVKVVLSLREEYLPNIEALRGTMPSIAHGRMRLEAFSGEEALDAIRASAPHLLPRPVADSIVRAVAGARARLLPSPAASLPPGVYRRGEPLLALLRVDALRFNKPLPPCESPDAAQRALADLVIEPSLLNLFCYQLNERRLASSAPRGTIEGELVDAASDNILSDFYGGCMKGLGRDARRFVETRLLSDAGFRLPIPEGEALGALRRGATIVSALVDRRLIRRETRQDTTYLMLVHDVLARPIIEARSRRRVRRRYSWIVVGTAIAVVLVGYAGKLLELLPQVAEAKGRVRAAQKELFQLRGQLVEERRQADLDLDRATKQREHAEREALTAREALKRAAADQQLALEVVEELQQAAAHQRSELEEARRQKQDALAIRTQLEKQAAEIEQRSLVLKNLNDQLEKRQGIPAVSGD